MRIGKLLIPLVGILSACCTQPTAIPAPKSQEAIWKETSQAERFYLPNQTVRVELDPFVIKNINSDRTIRLALKNVMMDHKCSLRVYLCSGNKYLVHYVASVCPSPSSHEPESFLFDIKKELSDLEAEGAFFHIVDASGEVSNPTVVIALLNSFDNTPVSVEGATITVPLFSQVK